MAAKKKPAGIRSLVYGMGKGKVGIEGLSVSTKLISRFWGGSGLAQGAGLYQAENESLFGRFLAIADP